VDQLAQKPAKAILHCFFTVLLLTSEELAKMDEELKLRLQREREEKIRQLEALFSSLQPKDKMLLRR